MIVIQVVPVHGLDAYKLLRDKVTHEAMTWSWSNKAKTRLRHKNSSGYIEIGSADGVVVAHVYPSAPGETFFLVEKLVGRLVAWFSEQIFALNVHFVPEPKSTKRRKK